MRVVDELEPDLLLLDLGMDDGSGLDVLAALNDADSPVRTILLTAGAEKEEIVEAIRLGARGLVLKHAATKLLYKSIRCVMSGEYWFGRDRMPDVIKTVHRMTGPEPPSPVETLTGRELSVIKAVLGGATNREIADQLHLSEQTVTNCLSAICDKVGVSNRLELALFALHHHLVGKIAAAGPPASWGGGGATPTVS